MTNPNQNVNLPPLPPVIPPTPNVPINPFAAPPAGPAAVHPNILPQANTAPNMPAFTVNPAHTVATKGLWTAVVERKASHASHKAEQQGRKVAFYKRIGEIATVGRGITLYNNPHTGMQEVPKPASRRERSAEIRVTEKQKKLELVKLPQNLDRINSGAYLDPTKGLKLSKFKTFKARRQVMKNYRRGDITIEKRNEALNKSRSNPKMSQLKVPPYQKKMAKNILRAQKSLRKEKPGAVSTFLRESRYDRAERKAQRWDRRAVRAVVKRQIKAGQQSQIASINNTRVHL